MSASYSNLDSKVCDIINSCRSTNVLHPAVVELCQSPEFEQIFWSSLNQDLHVICQRSQVLAHVEITAIQKAFAILMEKKEDHIRAVELYVDEILGLKFVSGADKATTLNAMIQTRHSILGRNCALPSSSQSVLSDHKPVSEALFVSDGSEWSRTSDLPHIAEEQDEKLFGAKMSGKSASRSKDGDEKLKRLFIVYHKARRDFDATSAKTLERTKSAKFLRDTCENCLAYIAGVAAKRTQTGGSKSEATCDGMLDELKATLEETTAVAEKGSGGKKRRFDESWENVPQEPARMRSSHPPMAEPLASSDPVPRGRTSETKRRPTISRTQEYHASPKAEFRQQRMNKAARRRSDLPHQLYPHSAGQSVHDVFGDRHQPHAERNHFSGHVYGDRYRPTYR